MSQNDRSALKQSGWSGYSREELEAGAKAYYRWEDRDEPSALVLAQEVLDSVAAVRSTGSARGQIHITRR